MNTLVSTYVSSIRLPEIREAVRKALLQQGVVRVKAAAGDETRTRGDQLKDMIQQSTASESSYRQFASAVSVNLSQIYTSKKKRADQAFWFSIICIAVAFVLLLVGLSIAFGDPDGGKKGIIISGASIVPTFFGATIFFLYRKESDNLKAVEAEIGKIKTLEAFLALAVNIPDKEVVNEAYKKIISQMNL